jgi:NADPH:quinone reductase-like Zn-dependent oxidoreductase
MRRQRGPAVVGIDFAGVVEAVGSAVTRFRPGDEVFGGKNGSALAEYLSIQETEAVVLKPANTTFEEAAAVPVAGLTALQALRDHGHVEPGQHVLINGASGAVGTFAVQIAKAFGAQVTAVCSSQNVGLARSLGADRVVDYTREDVTRSGQRYDLMLDIAGSHPWSACRRILNPKSTFVVVGASAHTVHGTGALLRHLAVLRLVTLRASQRVVFFIAKLNQDGLLVLQDMLRSGKLNPVIDRRYELDQAADAFRYLKEGHARGKIVVTV